MSNYPLAFQDAPEARPCGTHWRGIFFDGPQSDQNRDGDEIPVWVVYVGDAEAEPTDTIYKLHNFTAAEQLAQRMSQDRRLELIHEASPA